MAVISIKNLKKYYANQKAVDDISFEIPEGMIFGLLGPNGAGKSTLLRMITGIFYQDSGQVLIDNQPLNPKKHSEIMGYMPEERGLYKKMKIGEQTIYLAQLKGLSKTEAVIRAKSWFKKLDMVSWWDKKVEDLSKGMSQKLQFVTTVIHKPQILILDEPFSGLDPINTNVLKTEIDNLAKDGTTIIFSTHRMEQVEEICERIALINLGKKVLDGNVSQIKQDFKENIFSIEVSNSLTPFPESIDVLKQEGNHLLFHLKENVASNSILEYYIQQGNQINSFKEILPGLSDIFIRLVGETTGTSELSN